MSSFHSCANMYVHINCVISVQNHADKNYTKFFIRSICSDYYLLKICAYIHTYVHLISGFNLSNAMLHDKNPMGCARKTSASWASAAATCTCRGEVIPSEEVDTSNMRNPIPSGNQTWFARKSPINRGFNKKSTYFYGPFSSKPCLMIRGQSTYGNNC